jgi:hypothetical protein
MALAPLLVKHPRARNGIISTQGDQCRVLRRKIPFKSRKNLKKLLIVGPSLITTAPLATGLPPVCVGPQAPRPSPVRHDPVISKQQPSRTKCGYLIMGHVIHRFGTFTQ